MAITEGYDPTKTDDGMTPSMTVAGSAASGASEPSISATEAAFTVGATGEIPLGWILPVVGMGSDSWSRGSFAYRKPASKGGHVHGATDIYMPRGSNVVAPVGGTVISAGNGDISGHYARIRGDDGITYYFAHLDQPVSVARGQRIGAGASIGVVGNSGNARGTSTHLHFSMKRGSSNINPSEFLTAGKQQEFSPMSSIAGVNTPEEMDAWVRDQIARINASEAQYQTRDMSGLPTAMQNAMQEPEAMANKQKMDGQSMLGTIMDQLSRRVAGGDRTVMPGGQSPLMQQSDALNPEARPEVAVSQMREKTPNPQEEQR